MRWVARFSLLVSLFSTYDFDAYRLCISASHIIDTLSLRFALQPTQVHGSLEPRFLRSLPVSTRPFGCRDSDHLLVRTAKPFGSNLVCSASTPAFVYSNVLLVDLRTWDNPSRPRHGHASSTYTRSSEGRPTFDVLSSFLCSRSRFLVNRSGGGCILQISISVMT
jgi:hypothetical protein